MKFICVPCKRFYRVKKNAVCFEEGMSIRSEGGDWHSHKLWMGDLWECQNCHHQIISGIGQAPLGEHYQPDYQRKLKDFNPQLRIDDC